MEDERYCGNCDCQMGCEGADAPAPPLFADGCADHPHADPGDGRTECPTCGKYVWRVTHSCKGIPATAAARARWEARRD